MNKERTIADPADPARNEPSQARPESRDVEAGGREPDPTDFFIRLMKRAAMIGAARLEAAHERSEAERAARQAAAEAVPAEGDDDADPAAKTRQAAQDRADLAYQRVTHAMRYCAALAIRCHNERLDREMKRAAEVAVEDKQRRSRRKDQLKRAVKEAIRHEQKKRDAAFKGKNFDWSFEDAARWTLLSERLDDEDIERDLERCPLGELVGRICRELGIEPDWAIWQDAFWALEEARQKPPGSPYAAPPVVPVTEDPRSDAAEPPEPEPEAIEPEDPKPPEPEAAEPPEPETEAVGPEAPKPPEPAPEIPAAPPIRHFNPWQVQPEAVQRAERERLEQRILASYASYHRRV